MGHAHTVLDHDIIQLFEDNTREMLLEITGKQLREEAPEWNGQLGVGDTVTANDEKKRILEMTVRYPDPGETITRYEVYIG